MKQWHYAAGGKPSGSFTAAEIEGFFRSGKLNGESLVWAEGMQQWQALGETEDFKHLLQQTLPPPLPPSGHHKEIRDEGYAPLSEPIVSNSSDKEQIRLSIEQSLRVEPAGPWSRYFARQFDLSVITTVLFAVTAFALAYSDPVLLFKLNSIDARALFLVFLPAAHLINAIIITVFGNSIGKALFAIKAVPVEAGRSFSVTENVSREFRVWVSGIAFGIPLVCLATMIPAFNRVKNRQPTNYDEGRGNVLAFSSSKIRRVVAMLGAIAVLLGILMSNAIDKTQQEASSFPSSWTNPETSIAITIPAGWQYGKLSGPNGETLYGFTNMKSGVVAMLAKEQLPNQIMSTYAVGLANALSSSVTLGQWNQSEIANVWVASGTINPGNHPTKIYVTQKGSAFWRVVLVDQLTSSGKEISESEIVRILLSSAGLP
ncbi:MULTISPECIES: RDD family protein [Mesorhizobium]|uniref:DUF4339 domain-containing protein n=2 Tax=Mesorhizobium TaxID=68287 RepID=A0A1A5HVH1_RHILI|nr:MULTISPECIES: RDD family protein [Mesorhizobium]ETA72673.1 RDD family protein [Mesorhizobium japonicum R7A]MBE1711175.1 RDD family protein [Mesorhizobium japonicum]MBE1714668.1 RDD family protein [Mesorhizobium japonicum]MUT22279.1 DUF4339 domain-containing protein [Mesorhizobium japonicum]MUT28300.1 DUF4339 domain-containing protein [Mesorhizobium japonicum]